MVRSNPAVCSCGATYEQLRTGLTFAEVRRMMYRAEPPWRSRRRRGVLGFWRELKMQLWDVTHYACVDLSAPPAKLST